MVKWLGGIVAAVLGGVILFWLTHPGGPLNPKEEPTPTPAHVHARGQKTITLKGVYIPASQPNTTGPFVFRSIDLDEGQELTGPQAEVDATISARDLAVHAVVKRAVTAGNSQPTYEECSSRLKAGRKDQEALESPPLPSKYACSETDNGRIATFRIYGIKKYRVASTVPDNYDIELIFEHVTWDILE